jgi:uncharacterized protein (DUF2147 family)
MKIIAACLVLIGLVAPAGAQEGRWLTESGNLEVEIAPCGEALCGTVARVVANRSMSDSSAAMEPADKRPALGMKILSDFKPSGEKQWTGEIYNRENAKTYRCRMTLVAPDQLEIRGYILLPLIGKTQIWRRVAAATARE